ncbi:MAG: cupin domain-containing protein [Haloferacaceae archaeon]
MPEITSLDGLTKTPHAEVFDEHRPRAVRLRLGAGERVPEHRHPGTNVVLHLVSGRLELALDGETHELEPGQLVRFGGEREVSPRAIEASTAVVVFAPATDDTG